MNKIIPFAMLAILLGSCSHHTYVVKEKTESLAPSIRVKHREIGGDNGSLAFMPNATAFRMSGDYSNNVAVTLSPSGELQYFPAPTDITADSEPVELGEGWWLNNQGLGPNSVFTKYTFAEYSALPEVPSPEQLKLSIIPGARVTEFIELPMKVGDANKDIEAAKDYVKRQ